MNHVEVDFSVDKAIHCAELVESSATFVMKTVTGFDEMQRAFVSDVEALSKVMDNEIALCSSFADRAHELETKHKRRVDQLQKEMESLVAVPSSTDDKEGYDRALAYNAAVNCRNDLRRSEIDKHNGAINDCQEAACKIDSLSYTLKKEVQGAIQEAQATFASCSSTIGSTRETCAHAFSSLAQRLFQAGRLLGEMCQITSVHYSQHPLCADIQVAGSAGCVVSIGSSNIAGSTASMIREQKETSRIMLSNEEMPAAVELTSRTAKAALAEIEQKGYPAFVCIPSSAYGFLGGRTFNAAMLEAGYRRYAFKEGLYIKNGSMIWEKADE